MSYNLSHLKLDIGGEKGNAFVVVSIACNIVRQIEGKDASDKFRDECFGKNGKSKLMTELGGEWDYEDLLWHVVDKTGITLVSSYQLPISSDLYTIEHNTYL